MPTINMFSMPRVVTSLAYGITVDPLALFYSCQATDHFLPLLHFLALIRLRATQDALIVDPTGLPLHLQLIHLPSEIAHEIFAYVFAALVEDRKRAMLDHLGPCTHGGFCPGPGEDVQQEGGPAWDEHGRAGMHERRETLLAAGDPGVCMVDHLGFVPSCFPDYHCSACDLKEAYYDGCDSRQRETCQKVTDIWKEAIPKIELLVASFGLELLGRPGPTYRRDLCEPETGYRDRDEEVSSDLVFRPGVIGLAVSSAGIFDVSVGRDFGDHADAAECFRLDTPRLLSAREGRLFKRVVRSLRLVPAETPTAKGMEMETDAGEDKGTGGDVEDRPEDDIEVVVESGQTVQRTGPLAPTLMVATRLRGILQTPWA